MYIHILWAAGEVGLPLRAPPHTQGEVMAKFGIYFAIFAIVAKMTPWVQREAHFSRRPQYIYIYIYMYIYIHTDIHIRLYDPSQKTHGLNVALLRGGALETSFIIGGCCGMTA